VTAAGVDHRELQDRADAARSDTTLGESIVGLTRLAELALTQVSLSPTQYRLLRHLRRGRTIQSDLAFQLAITKQSVTRLVDGLVDERLITRRVDDVDRRRVIHAITPKGRRVLDRADEVLEGFLMAVLQDLESDHEIDAARHGIALFGRAGAASDGRVTPNGIVPGRKRRGATAPFPE
jgi:DNA-binding MarR family transcriptional regulator